MNAVLICYDKCSTCQKARKWLDVHGITYAARPIREQNPTLEELVQWQKVSGLPLKSFFNTSGMLYRQMELNKRLPQMTDEEKLSLLSSDGMLVKRPLLILENRVLVGFKETEWQQALLG